MQNIYLTILIGLSFLILILQCCFFYCIFKKIKKIQHIQETMISTRF